MLLTYHADILPFETMEPGGVYLMDPDPKFDAKICVYDGKTMNFVGLLSSDTLASEKHVTISGKARPVMFLDRYCPLNDLSLYVTYQHNLELPNHPTSTTVFNWDLFGYLEEYEEALDKGAFDLLID